jgi:DNA-binding transcriptional regulator GbsR (MarR family)
MSGRRKGSSGRAEEEVQRFVERFALAMAQAGFPRMAARVFVSLLTADDGKRTAAELAELLQISPAAVSGAAKFLLQTGYIDRERTPGERVDKYRVLEDIWLEKMVRKDAILASWEESLAEGVEVLGARTPAGRRLVETARFFAFVRGEFPRLMAKWKRVRGRGER